MTPSTDLAKWCVLAFFALFVFTCFIALVAMGAADVIDAVLDWVTL